jgi:hypothetical protein
VAIRVVREIENAHRESKEPVEFESDDAVSLALRFRECVL